LCSGKYKFKILKRKRRNIMKTQKLNGRNNKKTPTVAPGYNDEKFGEDATSKDIKNGNSTKTIRIFLDENDPS
jgi:hypothetical protein